MFNHAPFKRRYLTVVHLGLLCMGMSAGVSADDLPKRVDTDLQSRLVGTLQSLDLMERAANGELAVALADVSDPDEPRLAMVNGHRMLYAASLPKIAILLGAAVALDEGSLVMNPVLEEDLQEMIRVSCNACATRVLDRVGRAHLIEILQLPEYRFYDEQAGGGLWVGKAYGPETAYARDPVANLSHGATAFQTVRFYYLLHRRELVSREQSDMMLSALADPGLPHKFVAGLKDYPDLTLFRKSGSWGPYHADSALVRAADRAYIMVALAQDMEGGHWMEELAPRLHTLILAGAEDAR